ncbi:MAG: hypothetical protein WC994_10080 [Brumimicrobium sp.]
MARKLVLGIVIFVIVLTSNVGFSQYSIGGGMSSYHGLNIPIHRLGFNVFGEFPRSTNNTFTIRGVYLLPYKSTNSTGFLEAKDPMTSPNYVSVDILQKSTFFSIDGGSRVYFFNDYDIGLAMYAGGYIKGIVSSLSNEPRFPAYLNPDDYNTDLFYDEFGNPFEGKNQYSVLFAFGGTVGVKYQLPKRGALTFDLGLEFVNGLFDPNALLQRRLISPLSFAFNLAYRFDWF